MAEFVRLERDGEPVTVEEALVKLERMIAELQKNEEVLRYSLSKLLMERDLIKALAHHGVIGKD